MSAQRNQQPDDGVVGYERTHDESDAAKPRVVRNLTLMQRFVNAVFADPTMLDDIPDGATVILVPEDDPEAASDKIEASRKMLKAGKLVQTIHI